MMLEEYKGSIYRDQANWQFEIQIITEYIIF